jgi:hypothetical protein
MTEVTQNPGRGLVPVRLSAGHLLRILMIAFVGVVGAVHADYNTPEAEGAGQIHELDFGNNTMLINGYGYSVSPTVSVEIGGSYGAFTMLQKGMKIEYTYLHYADGARVVQTIKEVDEIEEY